jgi:hypothetical protein
MEQLLAGFLDEAVDALGYFSLRSTPVDVILVL